MLTLAVQFFLGLLYANAGEWLMHKYILHELGSKKHSFWSYHLQEHHAVCVRNRMLDLGYQKIILTTWNTQSKELVVLASIVLLHMPMLLIFPSFIVAVYVSLALYYYKHRKAHLDPVWAKRHLRWHYEHHLGGNTCANWCVTWLLFDYLLKTRVKSKTQDGTSKIKDNNLDGTQKLKFFSGLTGGHAALVLIGLITLGISVLYFQQSVFKLPTDVGFKVLIS